VTTVFTVSSFRTPGILSITFVAISTNILVIGHLIQVLGYAE
jgi:hypothetical protein